MAGGIYDTTGTAATIWCAWTCASDSTATNGEPWVIWNTGGTSASSTDTCWIQWNTRVKTAVYTPARRSAEEIERDRIAAEQRAKEREKERKEREERQRAAVARSTELLREWLDEKERERFDKHKRFHVVTASGRRYEVDCTKRQHNVFELDEKGKRVVEHCIYANAFDLPLPDNALAQKLLLETNEDEFRRIANQTRLAA